MTFGKTQMMVGFLERDNLKMLAYEVSGKGVERIFGGQISFTTDVVREAFIADPVKFANQVKAAVSMKPSLTGISEGVLFIPAEKSYIKTLPATDPVDGFVRSLPYFKEELVIDAEGTEARAKGKEESGLVNHVAFEKKLVEDFERPFMDLGKRIKTVAASVKAVVESHVQAGKYLLLLPFEKDVTVVAAENGAVLDLASLPKDVWVGRLNEFRLGKNFADIKKVYTVGIFDGASLDKLRSEQGLEVTELDLRDIYDVAFESYLSLGGKRGGLPNFLPAVDLSGVTDRLPERKYLFLVGAAVVGFVLVVVIFKNLGRLGLGQSQKAPETETPVVNEQESGSKSAEQTPAPAPEPKPADFKVRVLNGTKVTGEAGRLGDKLKELGFEVTETKNATSSGFEATRLRVAADVPAKIVEQVKTALLETYESVDLETLVDDVVKIEVVIGKKK